MISLNRIVVLVVIFLALSFPAAAEGERVYIHYDPAAGGGGKITRAAVIGENLAGLRGFEMRITFNPKVIRVVSPDGAGPAGRVTLGSMFNDVLVAVNKVDNNKGEMVISAAKPGFEVSGTTELVSFNLLGLEPGDPQLAFANGGMTIVDKRMREIGVAATGGALSVTAAGAPPLPAAQPADEPVLRAVLNKVARPAQSQNTAPGANQPARDKQSAAKGDSTRPGGVNKQAATPEVNKKEQDRTGQILTLVGAVALAGLLVHQYIGRRQRKRRHRFI